MAIKQNLPIAAILVFLVLAGLAALVFLGPSDEERLREAAIEWGRTKGPVLHDGLALHGTVADLALANGKTFFADFEKRDGKWVFVRELTEDFGTHLAKPSVEEGLLNRLGERLHQRFRTPNITFQRKGMQKRFVLTRDRRDVLAKVELVFSYPKSAKGPPAGLYVEHYLYKEGRWERQGRLGSLMDAAPRR